MVEGRPRHRGLAEVEVLEPAGHREARGLAPGGLVGGITRGDLGLDERAQQFLGWPALDLGRLQDLGGHPPHRGELQALEAGFEVRARAARPAGGSRGLSDRIGREGSDRHRRQPGQRRPSRPWPADTPGPAARMARISAARKRRWARARSSAAVRASRPWARSSSTMIAELGRAASWCPRRPRPAGRPRPPGRGRGRPARRGSVVAGPGMASWPDRHSGRRRG